MKTAKFQQMLIMVSTLIKNKFERLEAIRFSAFLTEAFGLTVGFLLGF